MKANFVLPEVEETFFDAVLYTETGPDETKVIVESYNQEAGGKFNQRPTGGVASFKSRNEQKRAATNQPLPGILWKKSDQITNTVTTALNTDLKAVSVEEVKEQESAGESSDV